MGVYYGNDFGTFKTSEMVEIIREGVESFLYFEDIKMGKANIALFDYIFSHVFKEVTLIEHFPEKVDNIANIDLIIEPNLKDYSSYIIQGFSENEYHLFITYVITFYSPNSELISSWTIKGKGFVPYSMSLPQTLVKEGLDIAMREVAANFMIDFCNQVDIKKMFYEECSQ